MSMMPADPAAERRAFLLPLSFLTFGVISFLAMNVLFAAGLPSIAGAWLRNPWALLVTHLFTLGYVTAIIMGAMYQLVPVILETRLWSERLGYAHLAFYLVGVVTLLAGFWRLSAPLLASGGILVLTGMVLFAVNTAATMRTARHWHHAATFLVFSLFYLAVTGTLGLLLALNLHTGFMGTTVRGHLGMHAAVGFGGWFTLTIMGVSYRLIPLFTLSHHRPGPRTWAVLGLTNLSILGIAAATGFDAPSRHVAAFLAVGAAGVLLFLREMHQIIQSRVRRELDLGVRFAMAAFLALVVALSLALIYLLLPPHQATPARAVGLVYAVGMGWVSLMVVGQMYKIVPFLVWTGRYGPRVGKERVPVLKEMYDEAQARWAFRTLVTGTALVVPGLWLTWLPAALAGAVLSAAGAVLFTWSMATIYTR